MDLPTIEMREIRNIMNDFFTAIKEQYKEMYFKPPCKIGDTVYVIGFYKCGYDGDKFKENKKDKFAMCLNGSGLCCDACKYGEPKIETIICEEIRITKDGIMVVDESGEPLPLDILAFSEEEANETLEQLKRKKQGEN